ncbi:MAG: TIGR00269 family protein [Candidatus Micrarchaeota archaeon]
MVKCANCSKEAVVRLSYNKTDLCGNCFCDLFENRVKSANRDFKLITLNQKVGVGVSGGKDSAALLYVLSHIVKNIHGTTLIPILIDEGISGYRDQAILKARELCDSLDLQLRIFSYKDGFKLSMDEIMKMKKANPTGGYERSCTYCGVFRKTLLNKAALELGCDTLAIGHNADDIAQTFLMNLLHNEPDRLKRFDVINDEVEGFVPRIKPLIYNLEKEAALYCELKELPYHRGECPYSNESFRGEIKNFLNGLEQKFPGVKFNLLRSYLAMRKELEKASNFERMFPNGEGFEDMEMFIKAVGMADPSLKIAGFSDDAPSKSKNEYSNDTEPQISGSKHDLSHKISFKKSTASKYQKCKNCGQNSSTGLCKACSFIESINEKRNSANGDLNKPKRAKSAMKK